MQNKDYLRLLDCPFCGGEAILESNKLRYGTIHSAYCQKCGAEITGFSEHEAIAAWNRRAQPANEPLVRCGDCAKQFMPDCPMQIIEQHEQCFICQNDNDYCSSGERKEGDA